jgi:hypothetical protein
MTRAIHGGHANVVVAIIFFSLLLCVCVCVCVFFVFENFLFLFVDSLRLLIQQASIRILGSNLDLTDQSQENRDNVGCYLTPGTFFFKV